MSTKRAITTKGKSTGFSTQIRQLETCLAQDQAKLKKIYPKVLADIDKAIKLTGQELIKSKGKSKTTKGAKSTARSTKIKPGELASLEKKLDGLKAEKALTISGYRKSLAQQKVLKQLEKVWAKKTSVAKKTRKKSKSVRKGKTTEPSFLQNLVEVE